MTSDQVAATSVQFELDSADQMAGERQERPHRGRDSQGEGHLHYVHLIP
jgi:hypothetical protein